MVAVLDPRLAKAGYRWDVVRALPPMRRTRHRAEAEAFLRAITRRADVALTAGSGRRRRGRLQPVADAPHGHDELGVVGVVLDLHPQPADVGVDEAAVAEVVVAPHPLEQLVAADSTMPAWSANSHSSRNSVLVSGTSSPRFRTMPCSRRSSRSPNTRGRGAG